MIKRIVKMTFRPEHIDEFKALFHSKQALIQGFPGCTHVELLQDVDNPSVFFTFSLWKSTDDIEQYRHSDLFKGVWAKTKILFDDKPEAYSVIQIQN